MKQESDLSKAQVFCKADTTGEVLRFVCEGLGDKPEDYGDHITLGIYEENKLIAGVIYSDIRPQRDVWLSIYSTSPRWATRKTLRAIFGTCFNYFGCKRTSVLVSKNNLKSLDMCLRLGFVKEGLLRQFRDDGQDCFLLGMLKNECKWSK